VKYTLDPLLRFFTTHYVDDTDLRDRLQRLFKASRPSQLSGFLREHSPPALDPLQMLRETLRPRSRRPSPSLDARLEEPLEAEPFFAGLESGKGVKRGVLRAHSPLAGAGRGRQRAHLGS
jgi:hypothetical protein